MVPSYRNTRPASLAAHSSGPLVTLQLRQLQLGRRAGLPLEAGRPGDTRVPLVAPEAGEAAVTLLYVEILQPLDDLRGLGAAGAEAEGAGLPRLALEARRSVRPRLSWQAGRASKRG